MKAKHGLAVFLVTILAACGDNTSAAAGSAPVSEPAEPPATSTPTATDAAFEMPVRDVFKIAGKGIVVTGQVKRGTVSIGDEVCTASGKRTTVEGIEMFKKTLETLNAGDTGGLLLKDLSKPEVKMGDVIASC